MSAAGGESALKKLRMGCGPGVVAGRLNCDMRDAPGNDLRCMQVEYRTARRCAFHETYTGRGEADSLDNREREGLAVEAVK